MTAFASQIFSQISFRVKPVYAKEGSTNLGKWKLRKFQEEVMEALASKKDALHIAPTGSGKTLSLLLGDHGAVGVYPNNRLLLDQQKSLDKVLRSALNARLVLHHSELGEDVLRIYEVNPGKRDGPPIVSKKLVAMVLLSGRYIGYERSEDGRLVPKRQVVLRNIVEKICYRPGGEQYIITLTTPDTALLIMAGMYRDFEKVGYTVHDTILSALEGMPIDYALSKERVATSRGSLAEIGQIRQCLLKYPWFIDEFHLYGAYEASGLIPILKVYREHVGWGEPVILSSATPKGMLYERLTNMLKPKIIDAEISEKGDPGTMIRGETEVEVIHLDIRGRGVGKWFKVGDHLPGIVLAKLGEIRRVISSGGRVFIVTDRINQVPPIVDVLTGKGIPVECGVTTPPPGCSDMGERLLVGSESISQGIDKENVRYGIVTGFNWATLIQRFGRIGRKTDSKIVITTPQSGEEGPLSELDGQTVPYEMFVETVRRDFPKVELELPNIRGVREVLTAREALLEYTATVAFAQVSKPGGTLKELSKRIMGNENVLKRFFGPPESIANIMMFRGSGFEVLVEYPNCQAKDRGECMRPSDISSVLRNYIVRSAHPHKYRAPDGIVSQAVKLSIDFTPGRQILVLEPRYDIREGLGDHLAGTITTLHELSELGFYLYIRLVEDSEDVGIELPIVGSVRDQTVAIIKTTEEVSAYLTYTLNAILIRRGEARPLVALLL